MANRKKTNVPEVLNMVMIVRDEQSTPSLEVRETVLTKHYSFHLNKGILALKRVLFTDLLPFHKKAKC